MKAAEKLNGMGTFSKEQFETVMEQKDYNHLMLYLGLTTKPGCNIRCMYCYNDSGNLEAGIRRDPSRFMTLEEYESVIIQSAELGAQSVSIIGIGETLMDPNTKAITSIVHDHGMIPIIFTNGTTFLNKRTSKYLKSKRTSLYLSLDSLDPDTYSRIIGRKDLLPQTLQGIENCLEAGFGEKSRSNGHSVVDFAINTMVMAINAKEIERIASYCNERDILFTARCPEKLGNAKFAWNGPLTGQDFSQSQLMSIAAKYSGGREVFSTEYGCMQWVAGLYFGIEGESRLCPSRNNKKWMGSIRDYTLKQLITKRNQVYPPNAKLFCPIHDEVPDKTELTCRSELN